MELNIEAHLIALFDSVLSPRDFRSYEICVIEYGSFTQPRTRRAASCSPLP